MHVLQETARLFVPHSCCAPYALTGPDGPLPFLCRQLYTGFSQRELAQTMSFLKVMCDIFPFMQALGAHSLEMRLVFCWLTGCGAAGGETIWMMTRAVLSCWPLPSPPRCCKPWPRFTFPASALVPCATKWLCMLCNVMPCPCATKWLTTQVLLSIACLQRPLVGVRTVLQAANCTVSAALLWCNIMKVVSGSVFQVPAAAALHACGACTSNQEAAYGLLFLV